MGEKGWRFLCGQRCGGEQKTAAARKFRDGIATPEIENDGGRLRYLAGMRMAGLGKYALSSSQYGTA